MNTLVTLLGALGGASFVGTVITALVQRRLFKAQEARAGAEAAQVIAATATELLDPLREELRATRKELFALRVHLGVVEDLLRAHRIAVPAFRWHADADPRKELKP